MRNGISEERHLNLRPGRSNAHSFMKHLHYGFPSLTRRIHRMFALSCKTALALLTPCVAPLQKLQQSGQKILPAVLFLDIDYRR